MNKDRKIKIYLQYPWKFPDSPYYKYLLQNLPDNLIYQNVASQKGVIVNKKMFLFSNILKKNIRKFMRYLYPSYINARLSPKGNYDLIHTAHSLSKDKNKPWVADFEAFWQLWVSSKKTKNGIKKASKIIGRKNCKKIMLWTKKVYDEFLNAFPEHKDKFEIVYPAIPTNKNKSKSFSKDITLLFVGRYFYWKGGLHALETFDRLTKKYKNVKAVFVSNTPKEIKENYSENKKIKFFSLIPQEKLFEIYSKSDIFVYPGYTDSFGFAYLEAMSFGIPVVTINGHARDEIIYNNEDGFIIRRPKKFHWDKIGPIEEKMVEKMVEKTSELIENPLKYNKFSGNCINKIGKGRFSIKERNKKLERIFKNSVE